MAMNKDEAIAAIRKLAGNSLTNDDIQGLDGCTQEQLKFIVEGYENIAKVRKKDTWAQIVEILKQVPEWFPLATKLAATLAVVFP